MSVQGTIELTDPDTAEASLTLTMTVGEWKTNASDDGCRG